MQSSPPPEHPRSPNDLQDTEKLFKVIALTGGPCGGKSTALSILSDVLENLGWKVFRVPETATMLMNGGVIFPELDNEQAYIFQRSVCEVMMSVENTYFRLARSNAAKGVKTIIICDRGLMDPAAYMPRDQWLQMLGEMNLSESNLRDQRYDIVVHLVSAANGAEAFYTTANNNARSEGLALAREVDERVMKSWLGHNYMDVVGNETGWESKVNRVTECVLNRLGLSDPRYGKGIQKWKFLVTSICGIKVSSSSLEDLASINLPVASRDFAVEHIYLHPSSENNEGQARIRKREQLAGTSSTSVHYSLTTRYMDKFEVSGRVERRRNLTGREYEDLRTQGDATRRAIHKIRRVFFCNSRYFQMDIFKDPFSGLVLLEAYIDLPTEKFTRSEWVLSLLPSWLQVENVTDKKEWSMYEIAKI